MVKDDLNKDSYVIGHIYVDTINNKLWIRDKYNDDFHEVQTDSKLLVDGKNDIIYYKTEHVGYFLTDDGKKDMSNFQDAILWLPKKMNEILKDFLYKYIDVETLNKFVDSLKKYDVTLYDCVSFVESHEEINDKQAIGINSTLFHSKSTHGYCYVIHRFILDEEEGLAIENNFKIVDIDGKNHTI